MTTFKWGTQLSKEKARQAFFSLLISIVLITILLGYLIYTKNNSIDFLENHKLIETLIGSILIFISSSRFASFLHIFLSTRTDYATAGLIQFFVRFLGLMSTLFFIVTNLEINAKNLILGGVITSALLILTAREPLSNLVAGVMLFFSRPFKIGDKIRIQGGGLPAPLECSVTQLGLMFTAVQTSKDKVTMLPNNMLISSAITPLEDIPSIKFDITLKEGILPSVIEQVLKYSITVPLVEDVEVDLKTIDVEIIVTISAAPKDKKDKHILLDQMLTAVQPLSKTKNWMHTNEYSALIPKAMLEAKKRKG